MGNSNRIIAFGPYCLDPLARELRKNDVPVPIGGRAFDMLVTIVDRAGQIVTRRELMAAVWPDLFVDECNVRVQMGNLRRELGCGRNGAKYITSVPGRGYCFVAPIEQRDAVRASDASSDPAGVAGDMPSIIAAPIRAGTSPSQSKIPATLDRTLGRAECLARVMAATESRKLVTLVGPGGIGKTTLAVLVAHVTVNAGQDVIFVDLQAITSGDFVLNAVATAFGMSPHADCSIQDLATFASARAALVVLDNCEHLISEVAAVVEALIRAADIRVLATSREAIRVQGEWLYILPPLQLPPDIAQLTARQAMRWPAIQLFMERAADGGYQDSLANGDAGAVADICRRLDGNPLAIEIVASRVGTYGIGGVASLLGEQFVLRWNGRRTAEERHRSIEATIDWSARLLSTIDRKVLTRLSIFAGGFSLEAAVSVVSDDEISAAQVAQSLANLSDKSLVDVVSRDGAARLRLLEVSRVYARADLDRTAGVAELYRRHANFFLGQLNRNNLADPSCRISPAVDFANYRAAVEWALTDRGDPRIAAEICAVLAPQLLEHSLRSEYRRLCRRVLSLLPDDLRGKSTEVMFEQAHAISTFYTGENAQNVRHSLERALALHDG